MNTPGPGRLRVAASQYPLRPAGSFEAFAAQVAGTVAAAADFRARLLVLPEYFTLALVSLGDTRRPFPEQLRDVAALEPRFVELMQGLARQHGLYLVAGSVPSADPATGALRNVAHVFAPSGAAGAQPKLHLTRFEAEEWGLSPGGPLRVFETDFGRLAVAICYDVELPELVRAAARAGAHVLAVPSNTDDRQGYLRVRYCAQARAVENQLYVVHSPTVGGLADVATLASNYGRAALLTPSDYGFARDGILAEGVLNQEELVVGDLDLGLLDESRSEGTVRPLRDSDGIEERVGSVERHVL